MTNQKKIVFKVPEFPHQSETFIIAQLVTAITLGFEVEIIVRKYFRTNIHSDLIDRYQLMDKVIVEDYKIPKYKISRFFKWIKLLIVHSKDLGHIKNYYRAYKTFSFKTLYQWCFYKKFNDAAILHVQYGTNAKPLGILKKTGFFKPALVVTFHGHDAFFPINGYIQNNGYYVDLFSFANLITANTTYLADKIIGLGCPKEKIEILPVGVDTDFFYPPKKIKNHKNQLKLITVGLLEKVKGHHYCIEVVNRLIKNGTEVLLTIIGEGAEHESLEKLINQYGLEGNVILLGKKSQEEVREVFWSHDIYLLLGVPVENGRRETQGLATLEAQACGLPVIVFDSGGIKYTLQDGKTGFVCEEFDVDSVVERIDSLIHNRNLYNDLRKNAVSFVKNNYSQKMIDKKWKSIYNKLMKDG